jgi:hypothetical protein
MSSTPNPTCTAGMIRLAAETPRAGPRTHEDLRTGSAASAATRTPPSLVATRGLGILASGFCGLRRVRSGGAGTTAALRLAGSTPDRTRRTACRGCRPRRAASAPARHQRDQPDSKGRQDYDRGDQRLEPTPPPRGYTTAAVRGRSTRTFALVRPTRTTRNAGASVTALRFHFFLHAPSPLRFRRPSREMSPQRRGTV